MLVVVVSDVLSWYAPVAITARPHELEERRDALESLDTFLRTTRHELQTVTSFLTRYKTTREDSGCCEGESN